MSLAVAAHDSPTSLSPPLPRDHPVERCVAGRLANSVYVELRTLSCSFDRGVLIFSGVVPTFYLKQVVTSMAEGIEGVEQIENRVEVLDFRSPRQAVPA